VPLKNVTFRAEEGLIHRARECAASNQTTLNEEFSKWLETYVKHSETSETYLALMERLTYVQPGRVFRRDEINEP
jgi:hypothetical protein